MLQNLEASDMKLASYLIHASLCSLSIVGKPLVQQQNVNIHSTCVLRAMAREGLQDPRRADANGSTEPSGLRQRRSHPRGWQKSRGLGGLHRSPDQWARGHGCA